MAEIYNLIDTGTAGYVAGTTSLNVFNTEGRKNFALYVIAEAPTGGSGSDIFDGSLLECDDPEFPTGKTYTCLLTKASDDSTKVTSIDNILGGITAGNATLTQKFSLKDSNYARYLKFVPALTGTVTHFKNLRVFVAYDTITRTTL
jgi:hypothetical protein